MSLQEKVQQLPQTPGVYLLKNKEGIPIYIGKAQRLRDRVKSYFKKEYAQYNASRRHMISEIADIDVHKTDSEIEALVLESKLIKTLRPRYNIMMRDDKQYFSIGFTSETFPKIIVTHQRKLKATRLRKPALRRSFGEASKLKARFVGPFVHGRSLKATLRALRKVFPYCSCKQVHKSERGCINYAIGIDPGYCCRYRSAPQPASRYQIKEYKRNVQHIQRILEGEKTNVLKELEKAMREAAKKQDFEKAAQLRNQLEGLVKILAHKKVIREEFSEHSYDLLKGMKRIEGYDISNIQGQYAVGSMVVFERGENGEFLPKKSDYRRFKIKRVKGVNDPAMIGEVTSRRLRHPEWTLPQLFLIDGGITQRNAALNAVERFCKTARLASSVKQTQAPFVWGLAKQKEELYTQNGLLPLSELPRKEANIIAEIRDEAHRFAISYYRKIHRKELTHNIAM